MANEKRMIYASSGRVAAEYMEKHIKVGDSDFLKGYLAGVKALAEGLEGLPAVDVVEVVRCKDCVSYNGEGCLKAYGEFEPDPMDFCSHGERKANG